MILQPLLFQEFADFGSYFKGSRLYKSFLQNIYGPFLVLATAVFMASALNIEFWSTFVRANGGFSVANLPLLGGAFLIIVLFFNACLTIASFRFVLKPVLIILVLIASTSSYFMTTYGIFIDKTMVQNLVETDLREAAELVSWQMIIQIGILGILPAYLIARADVQMPSGASGLLGRVGILCGSLLLAMALLMLLFKTLAPTVRQNRELRFLLTPTNFIHATHGYLRDKRAATVVVAPLGRDAIKGRTWEGQQRRTLTVIVVGETARAANFSLNGYQRITNPLLAQQEGLINFSKVTSCGTATAISLPCVFSVLGRDKFSLSKAAGQENLLDVLAHAGFSVVWRDNNSGCKGICTRQKYEDISKPNDLDIRCVDDECYDERMLDGVLKLLRDSTGDVVLVLHQKGSHGPAYAKRYPKEFARFGPVCTTNQFENCTRDSIRAAYDNTILYTDYFLSKTIDLLRNIADREAVDTAMLYFSDHGESLGENNVYLHGAPYMFAPAEQIEVPMIIWMSDHFAKRFGIDYKCLATRQSQPLSHDNIFHSVLGLLDVNTAILNPRLDLVHPCKSENR